MKRMVYLLILVGFFIALGAVVFAQTEGPGCPPVSFGRAQLPPPPRFVGFEGYPHGPMGPHGDFLKLSKEQRDLTKKLWKSYHEGIRELRYELAVKQLEMQKLFTDPKAGDTALDAKEKELSILRMKLFDKMAQMKLQWRKILAAEQLEKLDLIPPGPRGMPFDVMD